MSLRQITRVLRAPAFARTYATAAPTPPTASSEPAPAPASPAPASRVRKISASSPSKTTGRTHARYQVRPPRYYRGPFHPIQPPKPSAPNSREFIPGPFGRERLNDHYHNTLAADLMTITYTHRVGQPPIKGNIKDRLREWDDSSPYHKNRPLRGPRGGETLPLMSFPIAFNNIPRITGVTVHSMMKQAVKENGYLAVAGMIVQSITGVRAAVHAARRSVAPFELKEGSFVSVTSAMRNELAWRFLAGLVDVVMPRIKEYKGVKGSSGDNAGNISFGFSPEEVAVFPEVEVNYDMYPPKMIPGLHVTVHTTARNDKDARKLLQAVGVPFYGKFRD